MLNKVKKYIEKHQLLSFDKHYIVALSGGADSVCLLLAMLRLGYHVEAVHCNFHLRQEESNRDESFVVDLCNKYDIALHLIHFDTKTYAKVHKISVEMAARELRYNYFERLRQDLGFDGICVAHHQNDSAETVLLNLIRGTGIHGLTGINPCNGYIIRPLLCVNKEEITRWLVEQHQDYVTDSSNLQAEVVRNKIRLNILPLLKEINPNVENNILRAAQNLNEIVSIYDKEVSKALEKLLDGNRLDIHALLKETLPKSILFEWLKTYNYSPATIDHIYESLTSLQSGREWTSETHQLTIHQGCLLLEVKVPDLPILRIPEPGNYIYNNNCMLKIESQPQKYILKDSSYACLDKSKVSFPLTIRPVQSGDRFFPYGMKGSKLLSDYLTDRHLSIFEKRRTLVLCDKQGHIIWLVNHRPDARFCVNDLTQETLLFSFFNRKK